MALAWCLQILWWRLSGWSVLLKHVVVVVNAGAVAIVILVVGLVLAAGVALTGLLA